MSAPQENDVHVECCNFKNGEGAVYLDIPESLWDYWMEHPHMSLQEFMRKCKELTGKAITVLKDNHVDARDICYVCNQLIEEGEETYGPDGTPYHAKCYETVEKVELVPISSVFVDAIRKYHMKKAFETEGECITFLARFGIEMQDKEMAPKRLQHLEERLQKLEAK